MGPSFGCCGVSGGLQGRSNSVSQVDGVSDMTLACRLSSSVGRGLRKEAMDLPTVPSRRKLSPSFLCDARHFSSSLYATDAFQAATLVLELRGSASEKVSLCVDSLRGTGTPAVSSTGFCSEKL